MKVAYISTQQRVVGLFSGLALITFGIVAQTKLDVYSVLLGVHYNPFSLLLLIIGSLVFLVGFFGCCAACKRNYCLTIMFASLLTSVLVIEIGAVITAYVLRRKIQAFIVSELIRAINKYSESDDLVAAWDATHRELQCCGAEGYSDWEASNLSMPASCCSKLNRAQTSLPMTSNYTPVTSAEAKVIRRQLNVPRQQAVENVTGDTDQLKFKFKDQSRDNSSRIGNAPWGLCGGLTVAKIAGVGNTSSLVAATTVSGDVHRTGCVAALINWLSMNEISISCLGVAIAGIQVIGIVLACSLAINIRRECGVV